MKGKFIAIVLGVLAIGAAAAGGGTDREDAQHDGDEFAFHVTVSGLNFEYQGV